MASPATLYRFRLTISDIDRSFYDEVDLRAAMHPSENEAYFLTRVIAYALNYERGLEFSPGLCLADEPAISLAGANGRIALWIMIGNPAARRLHKASKASERVRVYTYKDPESLKRELAGETIHRAEEIEIFALDPPFLESLAPQLKRDNSWSLIHNEGDLVITIGDESFMSSLASLRIG